MIHTELFTQYIANNGGAEQALPSLFDKVPNITIDDEVTTFKDAFILNFCEREIGFETEELFALKLESRAKLVLPFYISKLKQLEYRLFKRKADGIRKSYKYGKRARQRQ